MTVSPKRILSKNTGLSEAILVTTGICLFAIFIHRDSWIQIISFTALLFTGAVITRSAEDHSSLLSVFGIIPVSKKIIPFIVAGLLIGIMIGFWYNITYDYPLLPSPLTRFAIIAPLIGITEELVFRGYVQTKSASAGALFSIVFASFGHTLYKYLVIKTLPIDLGLSLHKLVILTFLTGIILGFLRHRSKNVFAPAAAHALFDIVVYGGATVAPVWIWG